VIFGVAHSRTKGKSTLLPYSYVLIFMYGSFDKSNPGHPAYSLATILTELPQLHALSDYDIVWHFSVLVVILLNYVTEISNG
jgi:hypothetical protein